jgi:hypothetical protein
MARKLILFNGRWMENLRRRGGHAFVAAYSRADAVRVVAEVLGYEPRGMHNEIKVYWSQGAWGNTMDGITPERGIWVTYEQPRTKPERLQPKVHP